MAKLNQNLRAHGARGPLGVITTAPTPSGHTFEGGAGFARDPKGELFLLATTNMVGEDTFYEDAAGRDTRFRDLVRACAVADPEWTFALLTWLRTTANMRSASIVGGIEAAHALAALPDGAWPPRSPMPREFVNTVLQRADEPGEALSYWFTAYGRKLPKWLKRALGDAALRLYTPYTYAKWDSSRNAVRFADVIELSQIRRGCGDDTGLFKAILDGRPGAHRAPVVADVSGIKLLDVRAKVLALPVEQRRALLLSEQAAPILRASGLTWEAISGWLQGGWDAPTWERVIDLDLMPYGALIRNLANFERASIGKAARQRVVDILTDADRVAKSRLLPMAFLNAYNNVPGDMFRAALDEAATLSLRSVPRFAGSTLVLIDTSSSMNFPFSRQRSHRFRPPGEADQLMRWDAAALFGIALARACEQVDVVSFSDSYWAKDGAKVFTLKAGENLLAAVARFRRGYFIGGGTDTAAAVQKHYHGHDRVVCLTDEQASRNGSAVFRPVPATVPVHTFNLAGYQFAHAASGPNRFTVGGLSDAGFRMMAALEDSRDGRWPWEQQAALA